MNYKKGLFVLAFSLCLQSCWWYSFKGISIPVEAKTYYVENFQISTTNAPGDLNQRFSEALRAKVRNESRLIYSEVNPDLEFSGTVTGFNISEEAPQAGNTVAFNKLTITVEVNYTSNIEEDKNWKQSFSFFGTFPSDQDFQNIQEGLINNIFDQLMENIFNKAFTNW